MNDESLVKLCKQHKADAQRKLYEKYAPVMMAVCLRYMACKADAEESLQLGFIKVFRQITKFEGRGSLEGWIRRIMVYTCMDELKRIKRRPDGDHYAHESDVFGTHSQDQITDQMSVDHLMSLVMKLPEGYRLVFNMSVIEGYSHKEIAQIHDITESTSRSQLRKAKAKLREMLQDIEQKEEKL